MITLQLLKQIITKHKWELFGKLFGQDNFFLQKKDCIVCFLVTTETNTMVNKKFSINFSFLFFKNKFDNFKVMLFMIMN